VGNGHIHPVSALAGLTAQDLREADAEFIVLIKAFDDTFAQTVFARSSYKSEELAWGLASCPWSARGTTAGWRPWICGCWMSWSHPPERGEG
jgi:hypothetical protein